MRLLNSIVIIHLYASYKTFIYIDMQSMKLGYYNKLSHLYYSYDLPTTPKETSKLNLIGYPFSEVTLYQAEQQSEAVPFKQLNLP